MNDSPGPTPAPEAANPPQGCVCGGKGPAFSQMLQMMMPSDAAGEHFRNAGLEFLKGFRELLDQRIQSLSQKQSKGTKLNVE
jgi:hypothetical protein